MKAVRKLVLYVTVPVLTTVVTALLLFPEMLIPEKCRFEVPLRLRLALALGAEPARSEMSKELFLNAACIGNEDVVRLLMAHGLSPRGFRVPWMEENLITYAMESGAGLPMLRLLMEAGAEPPFVDALDGTSAEVQEFFLSAELKSEVGAEECSGHFTHLVEKYADQPQQLVDLLHSRKVPPPLRLQIFEDAVYADAVGVVRALLQDGVPAPELWKYAGECVAPFYEPDKTREMLSLILESGCPADYVLPENPEMTLLELALDVGNLQSYRLLVAAGADEAALRRKVGDLPWLAMLGCMEDVKAAFPSATEMQKRKAMRTAAAIKRTELIHFLLDSGMNPTESSGRKAPALLYPAQVAYDAGLLRRVLSVWRANSPRFREMAGICFSFAAETEYPLLLEMYGDVNAPTERGTLLEDACGGFKPEVVRFLLQHGACITPDAAFRCHSPEVLQLLLENGLNVEECNDTGEPLLLVTVRGDDSERVRLLLKYGADIHARNRSGDSALHLAESAEMVSLLLEAGADPDAVNEYGETPSDAALRSRKGHVLRALENSK